MRPPLVVVALLFSACATHLHVTGPYAANLSDADVQQIRHLVATRGSVITLAAIRRDRVHVENRRSTGSGWLSTSFFAVRHGSTWRIDEHSPVEATGERRITAY